MPNIDILGVPHAYRLTSPSPDPNAPVLVFIHGWLLSQKYWQPLVDSLSADYQCLLYDLRGFGESYLSASEGDSQAEVRSEYTLAAYARDIGILLEQLEIDRVWAIGHSLGGSIALWAAQEYSDRIRGVVCLNSGGGIYLKEEFERFRAIGRKMVKYRPQWLCYLPLLDLVFARAMVARPLSSRWGRQRIIDFVKADERAALGSLLDSTTETEVHLLPQLVAQLTQPVYFIAGAKDKVMEPKYVKHLASFHRLFGLDSGNVTEIDDCGHLSLLEKPEIVAQTIRQILQKHKLQAEDCQSPSI